jgi:AcrR family transcriptional regulator
MGVAERRAREREQRRREIEESAESLVLRQGVDALTIDAVAHVAELGKGTLYQYFRNKDELLAALSLKNRREMVRRIKAAVAEAPDGLHKLLAIPRTAYRFYREEPERYRLISVFETDHHAISKQVQQEMLQSINELVKPVFQEGQQDGSVRTDVDPAYAVHAMWAMSVGMTQMIYLRGELLSETQNLDTDHLFEHYLMLLEKGLATALPA